MKILPRRLRGWFMVFKAHWDHSIRRQLAWTFGLVSLLTMLSFGYLLITHQRQTLYDATTSTAQNLAHAIASSTISWVLADDLYGLQEVLTGYVGTTDLKLAMVLSPQGEVLGSTKPEQVGLFIKDAVSRRLLEASAEPQILIDHQGLVDVAEPIMAGERLVGWARVEMSHDSADASLRMLGAVGLGFSILAVAMSFVVAVLLARRLTRGLYHLKKVAESVEGGQRTVRSVIERNDEVGVLARGFNKMLDALADSERKLGKLNRIYAAWTECSDVTVREKNEQLLLEQICRILAEHVPFDLVWVGKLREASSEIELVAASDPAAPYLQGIRVSVDPDVAEGKGPMGIAIREGRPQIFNDFINNPHSTPWRAAAERSGFNAVASFPLSCNEKVIGAISVYTREFNYFDREVVTLLHGLTEDLSFALGNFERERQRSAAEAKVRLAAKVFENSKEGIVVTDADHRIISVNCGFTEITGYEEREALGNSPSLLASGRHDQEFYRAMWESIATKGSWQGEIWNRRKDGVIYPEWLTITCMRDEAGEISHYIGIFADISERKYSEDRIRHLAHYDALTDLPNRVLFHDRLEQAVIKAQRADEQVAVLFLDLDRFKQINDTLGHGVGDILLQTVAWRLLDCVREQDTVSRQGGDEFLILLPAATADGAAMVAQKMLVALAAPCLIEGHDLRITPSIGISMYPSDATDIDNLIKLADVAMYEAKDRGRNHYQFYTESMNASSFERLSLESGLRQALERNQFILHYQPQLNLASGRIIGCEALIRWQHPELGLVSPARFIPVAEDSGLIVPIGEWVLQEACRQLRIWQEAGFSSLVMAVNLSALQFHRPGLEEAVMRALNEAGVRAEFLELELTESILMHGVDDTLAVLQKFAALGLQLSIDDFGTGYSSLSYLKRFPIDKLKVDQSFVRELATDQNDAAIVRTIILMAHSLGLRVIAEGVETAEQLVFLREAGCDEMQGYHFSRPLPAEAFGAMLHSGKTL